MNVVPISGPQPGLLDALETLLEEAKRGGLVGVAIVAKETGGVINSIFAGDLPAYETLGAIEGLKMDFIAEFIETD